MADPAEEPHMHRDRGVVLPRDLAEPLNPDW
jgi:hypothetical protein